MPHPSRSRLKRRAMLVLGASVILAASLPMTVHAQEALRLRTEEKMLAKGPDAPTGTRIRALITVGDRIDGFRFEAIPDGISFKRARGGARVFVNHETSKVPFPYPPAPTTDTAFNDFRNAEVSELFIAADGRVVSGEKVIRAGDGYHRFCSNFLAKSGGFGDRPLLFTNEEGIDWVYEDDPTTAANEAKVGWNNAASLEGQDGARQIGAVVAFDPRTERSRPIWGMGRHNHENSVAIPGYGHPFLLSGDDAFNQNAPQSQLYAYAANNADAVWQDDGDLWAFVADDTDINDYYDFLPDGSLSDGGTGPITGKFIKVPKRIATGKNPDGSDMLAAEVPASLGGPYPTPPADGTWQRGPGITTGPGIDGPQWILEHWGDVNNVFQFLRIEDIAYDKRDGKSNVVYMADSGRGLGPTASLGLAPWRSTNGRVWKMVLDENDPTIVTSLSILIEGDDNPVKTLAEVHQPDNLETTQTGLLITEDPGSSQHFAAADQGLPNATTARVMHYRFSNGGLTAVLEVNQSQDESNRDEDVNPTAGSWGAWEATGIIDASAIFGPHKFLIAVQAHTLFVDINNTSAPDNLAPAGPDWTWKREGGQLLLVTIPGA